MIECDIDQKKGDDTKNEPDITSCLACIRERAVCSIRKEINDNENEAWRLLILRAMSSEKP